MKEIRFSRWSEPFRDKEGQPEEAAFARRREGGRSSPGASNRQAASVRVGMWHTSVTEFSRDQDRKPPGVCDGARHEPTGLKRFLWPHHGEQTAMWQDRIQDTFPSSRQQMDYRGCGQGDEKS